MITLKKITAEDDLQKIVFDIQQAKWVSASEVFPEDYSVEDLKDFLVRTESVFVVAYNAEQFAGMASAKILNKPSGDMWLYVDEVDVCENMQRKGVGTALMNYLFQFAKDCGCEEVWLGTEIDNLPANKLYTSLQPSEIQNFVGYTYTKTNYD